MVSLTYCASYALSHTTPALVISIYSSISMSEFTSLEALHLVTIDQTRQSPLLGRTFLNFIIDVKEDVLSSNAS